MNFDFVYKICTKSEWSEAKQNNIFKGTPLDLNDGYIHFDEKFGQFIAETRCYALNF